jgi:DNA-binding beta-propeller fold protein YncE
MNNSFFKTFGMILIALGFLSILSTQIHAVSFSLAKTIDLNSLVGDWGSVEVDVVGDELYVANWIQDVYYRIDPVTNSVLGSISLSNGILMDNHGSEYNPTTGRILHASDDDSGGTIGYDAFFETDTNLDSHVSFLS